MEGINQIKTGELVSSSEQQLIDCDTEGENKGCHRGLIEDAFEFVKNSGRLTSDYAYPYVAKQGNRASEVNN